ncbi:hypothetical protein AC249_AIPGENE1772 [Exaiptasia diaphana]|nr:hypothetical protein AC249_AIPGENE1772 [Exaiptasia diaphana]
MKTKRKEKKRKEKKRKEKKRKEKRKEKKRKEKKRKKKRKEKKRKEKKRKEKKRKEKKMMMYRQLTDLTRKSPLKTKRPCAAQDDSIFILVESEPKKTYEVQLCRQGPTL